MQREFLVSALKKAIDRSRIVLIAGPRQCGKTTLARMLVPRESLNYFDLEDPINLTRLEEPMLALAGLNGIVVIDEIQRRPELFPVLRVLADREDLPAKFLILGSASGDLMRQSSESLAGRLERIEMSGFTLGEVTAGQTEKLWFRGGFPLSFLAGSDENSGAWRSQFILTLLERDLPQWGVRTNAQILRRFWAMLCHYHGQIFNSAEMARALGISQTSVRHYLDVLTDAMMIRQLKPFFANISKRQVKAPKIYIRDPGLLHSLLAINTPAELHNHPKIGASWEGFVIEQVLARNDGTEVFFWATHQGAEIDLVIVRGSKLFGIEIKRTDTPRITPSIKNAIHDLGLSHVFVIYGGDKAFSLAEKAEAIPLSYLAQRDFALSKLFREV